MSLPLVRLIYFLKMTPLDLKVTKRKTTFSFLFQQNNGHHKQINKPNKHITLTYIIVILLPMTGDKETENETSSNEENRIERHKND